MSFVKLSSYEGLKSTGNIQNLIGINDNLNGRNIIIVEDIVDTEIIAEIIMWPMLISMRS